MKLFQKLCDKISPFLKTNNLHYIVNDKKNYYLQKSNMHFLPKSNIIHYLPLSKNMTNYYLPLVKKKKIVESLPIILKNIPGTWTPRPSFYDSAKADKDINKINNFIIIELLSKEPIYTPYELAKAIKRTLIYTRSLNISEDYFYPIVQHILVSIYPTIKISKNILINLADNKIDYTDFSDNVIGPLSIIECHVLKLILGNFLAINKNKIKIFAQDHTKVVDLEKYKNDCYQQTGQPFADFRMEFIDNKKLIFLDIKLKTDPIKNISLLKGNLSLTTKDCKNSYIIKINGDLPHAAEEKYKLNILSVKEKKAIDRIYDKINNITNDKNVNLTVKFNNIVNLVKNSYLNYDINNLTFSIILENSINDSTKLYDNELYNKFPNLNNENLFPKDGKTVNVHEWNKIIHKKVLVISENHSNEIKQLIIDNYNRIELF